MIKNTYRIQLASPAFLGNAEQKGVWRTPPLKALIREWWRVAVAPELGFETAQLRTREAALFGTAADDSSKSSHQSKIRLSLKHWNEGTLTDWAQVNPPDRGQAGRDPQVKHKEVQFGNGSVGSQLYLGFGPLLLDRGNSSPKLKNGAALRPNESNVLSLAFPDSDTRAVSAAITLAHWFGTMGGRSRNGWGSLNWQAQDETPALPPLSKAALEQFGYIQPLGRCLERDWPHAIGGDHKGALVWLSATAFTDWREAMRFLAQTKINFRVELGFSSGDNSPKVEPRHIVAYPVTKHHVNEWGRNVRIANTLRFKLLPQADGGVQALIYHTPCKPTLPHGGVDLLDTWQRIHAMLDANPQLARLA